jgi:hypothetical protein
MCSREWGGLVRESSRVSTSGPALASSDFGYGAGLASPDFPREAADVLGKVCRAIGRVIEHLPGPIRRAADLQRVLGVDRALAWQLFRVGSGADPIEVGPHVPRPAPLGKALEAAARCGVPPAIVREAAEAGAEIERLVDRHAGDRGTFDAMTRGLAPDGAEQLHLKDRRAAFRANSNIWGINALASYSCLIFHAGEQPGMQDSALVVGHVGVQKLRPAVRHSVGYQWIVRKSDETGGVGERVSSQRQVEFLEAFSTSPLPKLTTREVEPGAMEASLELNSIGRSGAVTYFARHIARAASDESTPWWGGNGLCRLPTEVAVHDVLVPSGWSNTATADVTVFGNLQNVSRSGLRDDADRLPCDAVISHLGQELGRLQTPAVPRCPEMIAEVLRGMGWEQTRFDIFRCAMEYPVLHAGIATRVHAAD